MNLAMLKSDSFYHIYNLGGKSVLLDLLMVFAAKYLVFLIIISMLILAIKGGLKEKKVIFITLISLGFAFTAERLISVFYFTPRPFIEQHIQPLIDHVADASFPSSHTIFTFVIAFVYLFYKSKYALLFLLSAFLVAFARVYVGVHYPLDILGGMLIAFISVILSWQIKRFIRRYLI